MPVVRVVKLPPCVALVLGILEEDELQHKHLGQRVRLHRPGHRHPVRFDVGGLLPREVVFHRIMVQYTIGVNDVIVIIYTLGRYHTIYIST